MEEAPVLIEAFKTECVMQERRTASDGEGGFTTSWEDGAPFMAAIVRNTTAEVRIAEQQGFTNAYTVTVSKNVPLEFHDVFKRVSDGQVFRVTSNADDVQTPDVASFSFWQVNAEEWELS